MSTLILSEGMAFEALKAMSSSRLPVLSLAFSKKNVLTTDALTNAEVIECKSQTANPCLNGGSCVVDADGSYACACVDGRDGARCEKGKKFVLVACDN